ncbi:MAG: ABC transporter permease [Clostridia bacterium]|nr:ABC transporter permease [Clostridia bacterium]
MFAILKKEFKNYFLTPIGYVFIGLFLVVVSLIFYNYTFSQHYINFEYILWDSIIVLTFITPVLTMRMFAEEKKSGTDILIMTSPRSIFSIVMGKFLAACSVILITIALFFIYFIILCFFGKPSIVVALVTSLGFFLLAMSYISFGMFASCLTESQIIAAIITIAFFLVISFLQSSVGILSMFSLVSMFQKFPLGVISLKEVVGYLSFSILFILLTIIILQRRKSVK